MSADRFLADAMCGRLATYLRMCGYDTAYALDRGVEADDALAALAREEDRRLVTRDRGLAERVEGAVLLTSRDIEGQLRELRAVGVDLLLSDPSRCSACNGQLDRIPGDASTPEYAPDPALERVWCCANCGQFYWKGSHWNDVEGRLADL
ncbi:MAG: Mut7-C RNAse domain-containing protein [Halobacteriaceae archaeon]